MFRRKVLEKIKTFILYANTFFFFLENRAVHKIMWKNNVEPHRPQMNIRPMRIACWTPKATNTDLKHLTFIALPIQQWFHEHVSMLLHMYYITSLVYITPSAGALVTQKSVTIPKYRKL